MKVKASGDKTGCGCLIAIVAFIVIGYISLAIAFPWLWGVLIVWIIMMCVDND